MKLIRTIHGVVVLAAVLSACGRGDSAAVSEQALSQPRNIMRVVKAVDPSFGWTEGMAIDASGNLYVAQGGGPRSIRKITPGGVVTTLARPSEGFAWPGQVTVDGSGNVFVADGAVIHKITPAGVVTAFAGTPGGWGSADGTGPAARFSWTNGVTVDGSGNLYVADTGNNTIRKVTPDAVVTTIAGTPGVAGSADGVGAAALFSDPMALALDPSGNLYVTDNRNNTIRKITPDATVTTLAGMAGVAGFADGNGSSALFAYPWYLAVDASGNVYVSDEDNALIRKITPDGVVTTLAGQLGVQRWADGTGTAATFASPAGMAVDGAGNVYVTDFGDRTIRKITPDGVVRTIAGTPDPAYRSGIVDGTVSGVYFADPTVGLAVDGAGNVYVSNTASTVLKFTAAGGASILAGSPAMIGSEDGTGSAARFGSPNGAAVDGSGNVYVADGRYHTIRKITPAGVVTTFAGTPGVAGSADGPRAAALFSSPAGLALDNSGNLYVADSWNFTIRMITPSGVVSTIAGTPGVWGAADGTGPAAQFTLVSGIAVSGANVYVTDQYTQTVRKITQQGNVTTVAAQFSSLAGITADTLGNVYVADSGNSTIWKITQQGVVTIVAGVPGQTTNVPGPLPTSIAPPTGVAFDAAAGRLLVSGTAGVMEVFF